MNLAYVITRGDDLGGSQVHVRDLCGRLRDAGHSVTVLAGGCGAFTCELDRIGIPWRNIPHLRVPVHPARDAAALLELVGVLRALRPDIVLTHTAKAGMLGRAAARLVGIPAVFTPHGWSIGDRISQTHGRVFRLLEKAAARITHRIVNVCEYERRLALHAGVAPACKMAMVYNGLPDVGPNLRARPDSGPPSVTMVARMAAPKDHATLLRAAAGVEAPGWTLSLVGDGPREAAVRRMAGDLGLARRVRFQGFQRDVPALLADAHALVLSSASEAFPYVVLEAMRAGLPVLASNVGGIPEAVVHGETGFLVPPGDVRAFREHLALLVGNPQLRRRLGEAGRRRFLERFTLERMVEETVRVYREVLVGCGAIRSADAFAARPRSPQQDGPFAARQADLADNAGIQPRVGSR